MKILESYPIYVTQGYKATHKALDITGINTAKKLVCDYITAHSDGIVTKVVANYNKTDKLGSSYGNYVIIKHANGFETLYAHMKYGSVVVKVGQKVTKGQRIGYMGNTGHSLGAHLHFEIRLNGSKMNPQNYLDDDLAVENSHFVVGVTYTLRANMKVRTAPGTDCPQQTYAKLTADGKKNALNGRAVLKEGTKVTILSLAYKDDEVWARIPSGFICAKQGSTIYLS